MEVLSAIATLPTAVERGAAIKEIGTKLGLKSTDLRNVTSTVGTLVKTAKAAAKGTKKTDEGGEKDPEAFERGDDVEIADRLIALHTVECGGEKLAPVFTEGAFHAFCETSGVFEPIENEALSRDVQGFAGKPLGDSVLNINYSRVTGAIKAMGDRVKDREFFSKGKKGLAFKNGFVTVSDDGSIEFTPGHDPMNRARFAYDFDFVQDARSDRFLRAAQEWFRGDADATEKTLAMLEHLGLTILGRATSFSMAAVYYGPRAGNGKSTAAAVFRGCIPAEYISSLSPQQLGEKFKVAELCGKIANIMDDLPAKAIMDGEQLKICITGKNPITAERKNQDPFSFVPQAGWLVCGNCLPHSDDPTDGYFRRWLIITFSRVFTPSDGEVRDFEKHILEERHLIVSMAIQAAARAVKRGGYTLPTSHTEILEGWKNGDPVRGFVASECDRVDDYREGDEGMTLFEAFKAYCDRHSNKQMTFNTFSQRLDNIGLRKHTKDGKRFLLVLKATRKREALEAEYVNIIEQWAANDTVPTFVRGHIQSVTNADEGNLRVTFRLDDGREGTAKGSEAWVTSTFGCIPEGGDRDDAPRPAGRRGAAAWGGSSHRRLTPVGDG